MGDEQSQRSRSAGAEDEPAARAESAEINELSPANNNLNHEITNLINEMTNIADNADEEINCDTINETTFHQTNQINSQNDTKYCESPKIQSLEKNETPEGIDSNNETPKSVDPNNEIENISSNSDVQNSNNIQTAVEKVEKSQTIDLETSTKNINDLPREKESLEIDISNDTNKVSLPETSLDIPQNSKSISDQNQQNDIIKKNRTKNSKEMVKVKKRIVCMMIPAVLCFAFGITAFILWPPKFNEILKTHLILSPNSTCYKMWKETPVPMYLKIYLFNWTNQANFRNPTTEKPHFDQIGPYVFKEVDYKVNEKWNENGTLTFQQKRVWYFVPEMSNGSLSDNVTILNPIIATVAYYMRFKMEFEKIIAYGLLNKIFNEEMSITVSVREILFDGYKDQLLELVTKLGISIPFDKFAFFYQRNSSETYDGVFNIVTGATNFNQLGTIKEWNYKKTSPSYPGTCGKIETTLGDLWPPLDNNRTVSVFSPDICTTLSLKNAGKTDRLGLTGVKYVSDIDTLDNGTRVSSRKCYCENAECLPSGALNISTCKFGSPTFVSLPHFYLADEKYRTVISGMNPNKDDHEFVLVVQPLTGTPMQVRAALQINFLIQPEEFAYFRNLPSMLVPMMWFTQEVNLSSELSDQIKLLVLAKMVATIIFSVVIGIGVLLTIFSTIIYLKQRRRDELTENLLPKDIPNRDTEVIVNSTG